MFYSPNRVKILNAKAGCGKSFIMLFLVNLILRKTNKNIILLITNTKTKVNQYESIQNDRLLITHKKFFNDISSSAKMFSNDDWIIVVDEAQHISRKNLEAIFNCFSYSFLFLDIWQVTNEKYETNPTDWENYLDQLSNNDDFLILTSDENFRNKSINSTYENMLSSSSIGEFLNCKNEKIILLNIENEKDKARISTLLNDDKNWLSTLSIFLEDLKLLIVDFIKSFLSKEKKIIFSKFNNIFNIENKEEIQVYSEYDLASFESENMIIFLPKNFRDKNMDIFQKTRILRILTRAKNNTYFIFL